jgi:small subunit ribosomal protein S8|uniref:Ribosomal protein S8 n=2 Tax=Eukaryota TaxID=2759 RepID=I0J3K8_9EUGL|nr:ribosomal protein S8 [Eutreptiella gymnastica]CCE26481.1 ribosomal protein S8 [Eutreptiella gymnastica]|tara:strand:- start:3434 stop:3850 length:417 start_codon:yes stop_codon:yes gene_type:complete
MVNDIVADLITRIRNANCVKAEGVLVLRTKLTVSIVKILKEEGFIDHLEEVDIPVKHQKVANKYLLLSLKYKGVKQKPYITALKRISKPGLRVYVSKSNIPKVLGGIGIAVISTSKGLMTDRKARIEGIGGEVLCYIW